MTKRVVHFGLAAIALIGGCLYAIFGCASFRDISGHAIGLDDAFISYRYAQNLAEGHGLVFNVGDRTEGFSNLLYTLLMAIPFAAGWGVYKFSMLLNCIFAMGALFVFALHMRRVVPGRWAALATLLFACSPSLWLWVSSGLETILVVLLQLAIWFFVELVVSKTTRHALAALCACFALLVLTRADGFVLPVIATAYLVVKRRRRPAILAGLALVATAAALFAWRWSYYGDLLPNTYYAKVTSTPLVRLVYSIKQFGGILGRQGHAIYVTAVLFCFARALFDASKDWKRTVERLSFDLVFAVGWIGYWLYVGGDVFEDRFLIVLVPLGICLLFRVVLESSSESVHYFAFAAALVVELAVAVRDPQYGKIRAKYDRWVLLGKFLRQTHAGDVLAIDAAGKVPFFSGLPTIDMLGLTDRFIAHEPNRRYMVGHSKYDPDYVLGKRPALAATWFEGDGLDMQFGLTREKYESFGYRVRYIVNATNQSKEGRDIIDVENKPDDVIISLVRLGYWYGVLQRRN